MPPQLPQWAVCLLFVDVRYTHGGRFGWLITLLYFRFKNRDANIFLVARRFDNAFANTKSVARIGSRLQRVRDGLSQTLVSKRLKKRLGISMISDVINKATNGNSAAFLLLREESAKEDLDHPVEVIKRLSHNFSITLLRCSLTCSLRTSISCLRLSNSGFLDAARTSYHKSRIMR